MSIQGSFNNNLNDAGLIIGLAAISKTLRDNQESEVIREKVNRLKVLELEIAKAKDLGQPYSELEKLYINELTDLNNYLEPKKKKKKHKWTESEIEHFTKVLFVLFLIIIVGLLFSYFGWDLSENTLTTSTTSTTSSARLWDCPLCGLEGFSDITDHFILKHGYSSFMIGPDQVYICPYCSLTFEGPKKKEKAFREHLLIHCS